MIKGGSGGALTNLTGLKFEQRTKVSDAFEAAGFRVLGTEVFDGDELICVMMAKRALYRFLKANGVVWQEFMSNTMEPDECLYFPSSNHFLVIEKKWQEVSGSVDEKLAACDFKLRRYERLFQGGMGASCSMIYLLNDWFRQPKYSDVLDYMTSANCLVYFEEIPAKVLREAVGRS